MGLCFSKAETKDDDSDHHVEFAAGKVHLITTKEAWDQKLEEANTSGKIVIANFSATWCGPCKDFSTSWDIKATPTFFFLKEGQQIDKLVGANKIELEKKITAVADSLPPNRI
ncbi:thioredoxin H-type isoform X2 [Cucumis sativus]|uniref:thioredoxin H-type isoform X2 n=1 Tax=Cucumis sativus TaxID=3659 RepID=UPI0012F5218E|nr:thioredoxin H-type isoform X2 [Cucumis sativus]